MNAQNFLRHRLLHFPAIYLPSTASFAAAQSTKCAAGGGRFFMKSTIVLAVSLLAGSVFGQDIVINAFEGANYGTWTVSGTAFGTGPVQTPAIAGIQGTKYVTTKGTISATGTLTSPSFTIQRPYLNFRIAGKRYLPANVGIELIVGGTVVRAASASSEAALSQRTWSVGAWIGSQAQIRINDNANAGWIAIDHIVQSNIAASTPIDASVLWKETYRPEFHFTSKAHQILPAGNLFYYSGKWHIFCDHLHPVGTGTNMVWGWNHAVSDDLFHWEDLPVFRPETAATVTTFVASAIVDWNNDSGLKDAAEPYPPILAFYVRRPLGEDLTDPANKTTQCMAYSTDGGDTWQTYVGNPVVSTADWRDRGPHVFRHSDGYFYMLLSLTHNNVDPADSQCGVFRSTNLKSWTSMPAMTMGPENSLFFWEHPELFKLPIDGNPANTKWIFFAMDMRSYRVGSFNGTTGFTPDGGWVVQPIQLQHGTWCAPHSYSDAPNGRRIQLAWSQHGYASEIDSYPGMPFEQQLNIPCELTLRNTPQGLRVFSNPVREIAFMHGTEHEWTNVALSGTTNPLSGINKDLVDLSVEINLGSAAKIKLNLRGQEIVYFVTGTNAGKLKCGAALLELPAQGGRIKLRVLLDRSSVEVFGNDGAKNTSVVFFPHPANHDLSITAEGGAATIVKMKLHEMEPDQVAASILNVNFDADTAGGLPSQGSCGNTGDAGLTYKVVAASTTPVDPFGRVGNKSLYLKDASPTKSCTVNYDLSSPAENYASVEVDVHYVNSAFISIGSGATYAAKLRFNSTSLDYQVGATWVSLATIGASQTYAIAVHLDVAAQTYSVWVNGIEAVTDEAFNAAVSQVDRVQLAAGSSGGSNHSAFFDNLSVKAVP